MGRRSLRKVDPSLDLSRHLKTLDDLPRPFDAAALFGDESDGNSKNPLEVEMGSGKGLFLASAAAGHPEHNFLGVELAGRYARFAAARLAQAGLSNAVIVSGDGLKLFRELLPDDSLAAVHVYFPDPWWKKRHKKRRVMNETFVADIERTLRPGGQLHFWTDVEEYFQQTLTLLAEKSRLQGPLDVPERAAEHDLDYRTHFERRMRLHHLAVYRSLYVKPLC
jgi:tRNA (guanine-N7-)-methyltransferase